MKKQIHTQWWIVILVALTTLGGALLRRQQLLFELLEDGSLAPDSHMHIYLIILCTLCAVGLICLLLPLEKRPRWEQSFSSAILPAALQLVGAVCLICGNILLWVHRAQADTAGSVPSPALSGALASFLPPLGIVSAVCIAAFAICCLMDKKPSPLLYMLASVYLVVRLIVCFQVWNIDPSVHDYCFQLLAVICCMLGTFQIAGFSFDKGKRRICLFWTLLAVLFCGITSADMLLRSTLDETLINFGLLLSMAVSSAQLLFGTKQAAK